MLVILSSLLLRGPIAHSVHLVGVAVGVSFTYVSIHGIRHLFRKKPKLRVLEGGKLYRPPDPPVEISSADIDRLLDKIADHGMSSLTKNERKILEMASRQKK